MASELSSQTIIVSEFDFHLLPHKPCLIQQLNEAREKKINMIINLFAYVLHKFSFKANVEYVLCVYVYNILQEPLIKGMNEQ